MSLVNAQKNLLKNQALATAADTARKGGKEAGKYFINELSLQNAEYQNKVQGVLESKARTIGIQIDNEIKSKTKAATIKRILNESLMSAESLEASELINVTNRWRAELAEQNIRIEDNTLWRFAAGLSSDPNFRKFLGKLLGISTDFMKLPELNYKANK